VELYAERQGYERRFVQWFDDCKMLQLVFVEWDEECGMHCGLEYV
jgi:hypothetical protein